MAYTVNSLTTTADCDSVIELANKDKADLNYRRTTLQHQQKQYSESVLEVLQELNSVGTELTAEQSVVATLPDGKAKTDAVKRVKRLEYRQFLLNSKSVDYNAVALLNREMGIALIDRQLNEIDNFTTEVLARKAAL